MDFTSLQDLTFLLTIPGIGVAVAVFLQLFVKESLQEKYPVRDDGTRLAIYNLIMNGLAFVFALILSYAVHLIMLPTVGETFLQAFMVAFGGTAFAVLTSEVSSNVNTWRLERGE